MIKNQGYDSKIDMFAAGVVLYNLLTGKQPFFGKDDEEIKKSILLNPQKYPDHINKNSIISLLNGLLEKNPEKRISIQEAKLHPWIQEFIMLHQQQTVKKAFVPNLVSTKNLNELVKITNIKNIVWTNLLTYLDIDVANKIRLHLISNYEDVENNQEIQGKFSINYESFLEVVIELSVDNTALVTKLQGKYFFYYFNFLKKFWIVIERFVKDIKLIILI